MEEIKVGEYVRTKEGIIGKIEQIGNSLYWLEDGSSFNIQENSNKHSKNIIDLIEEGDYVNGKYVYSIGTAIGNLPIVSHTDGTFTPSNMIKSIVTKEQFSNIEYRLEG